MTQQEKMTHIDIKIPAGLKQQLKIIAVCKETTMKDIVSELVENYIKEEEQKLNFEVTNEAESS